jgi:hypothetical protein
VQRNEADRIVTWTRRKARVQAYAAGAMRGHVNADCALDDERRVFARSRRKRSFRGLSWVCAVAATSLFLLHGSDGFAAKTGASSTTNDSAVGASSSEVSGVRVEGKRGAGTTDGTSELEAGTGESRLPPLPAPPSLVPPAPESGDVEELEGKLTRLKSADAEIRNEAARELLEVRPRLISAVVARLGKLSEHADRERMKRALATAKERVSRGKKAADDAELSSDLFLVLVQRAAPKDEGWKDLVELFAISRMFAQIGTVEAARGLVEIYVRFGEFVRVDVQNRLAELKDGAVAALVEARRHKAEKIAQWAERQLDRIGKAVPGEAIRTANYELLADILRAFGRTKDPTAARIIVSYTNNERHHVREAARQAVVLMGDVALWQLREAYEDVVGKRARRDWNWERTARELFFEYDKLRRAVVGGLFDEGKRAERAGKYDEMAKAYDAVLARLPEFEQRADMAEGYFAYAQRVRETDRDRAETALVRVQRLAKAEELRSRAKSLYDTLVAERRLRAGVFDTPLLQTAVERDPSNGTAKGMLTALDRDLVDTATTRVRWLTSGAIAVLAAAAIALILRRRKRSSADAPTTIDSHVALNPSDAAGSPAPPAPGPPPQESEAADEAKPPTSNSTVPAAHTPTTSSDLSGEWAKQLSSAPPPKLPKDPFEGL